jgi:hypothetical protein
MVSVQLRNAGEGIWRAMTLPVTVQLAQTVAAAARTLQLADQVKIAPSAPAPPPAGRIDLKI